MRVFDASGALTYDSSAGIGRVPINTTAVGHALAGRPETYRLDAEDSPLRARTLSIRRDGRITGVLEVAQSEDDISDTLSQLLVIMIVAYPIALVVAGFGGLFLARRALAPVDEVSSLARRITSEDLGQRLNLRLPDDEVGRLARTFDEMIGRLDDAFRRQRRFTADASHELRTPLTVMRGQIDVALQMPRDAEAYRQVLREVNGEVDHLIRLTSSLLTMAHADAGQIPLAFEHVALADLVDGAMEQLSAIAGQQGVDLRRAPGPPVTVWADEDLLLQLLLNLLDNAIKYTPAGGRVTVGWSPGERVEVWVRDTGEGIPEEHIPHLFDRFYRVDKARSRAEGGVGLGLAISRWIAEAHGGSMSVQSVPGKGSTFSVLVPNGS